MSIIASFQKFPKNVRFESQETDEKVYYILRQHPITTISWITVSIALLILPVFLIIFLRDIHSLVQSYIPDNLEFISILLWYSFVFFFTFEAFLLWFFNVYIITDRRVIDVDFHGLWRKKVSETSLGKVEDATYETNQFLHVMFDYGNINIQTAAEKREFEFQGIPHPAEVHDLLTNLVQEYNHANGPES
jgi:hypothetical protein